MQNIIGQNDTKILKNYYKAVVNESIVKNTDENQILKRYKRIIKSPNSDELILDFSITKRKITFITGNFRKFTISLRTINEWDDLKENEKYDIKNEISGVLFGGDKLYFPFEEVLYRYDKKYRQESDARNASNKKEMGERIKHLREKCGKKQCDITNVSERELSRIENGHVWASFKTQRKIAEALGITYKKFLDAIYD